MITDEDLYAQIRQGQIRAFDQLYSRYERPLFGFILRYVGQPADAEEIFHEAFLRILDTPSIDFEQGSFRSWIYRIARNLSLNRLRTQQRAQQKHSFWQQLEQLEQSPSTRPTAQDDAMIRRETLQTLHTAIAQLPSRLHELVRLRTTGMAYEEIAHVLEIPVGTVKSRMHEIVRRLRKEIQP